MRLDFFAAVEEQGPQRQAGHFYRPSNSKMCSVNAASDFLFGAADSNSLYCNVSIARRDATGIRRFALPARHPTSKTIRAVPGVRVLHAFANTARSRLEIDLE